MTAYLLAVSVGPVQGFIAAARRTRDLWFGSHMLSHISAAAARAVSDAAGPGEALIFPPDRPHADRLTDEMNVANIILAELSDITNAAQVAKDAEQAALKCWESFAQDALALANRDGEIDLALWNEQLRDVVEVYSAWVPCPARENYKAARTQVMRLLAGRKTCRDFYQAAGRHGIPKSSLDGARESVLRRRDRPAEGDPPRKRKTPLWIRRGEQLDVIGVTKRGALGHQPYPSVSRVAADAWLRGVASAPEGSPERQWLDELVRECRRLTEWPSREQGVLRRLGHAGFAEFPFEGSVVYRSRHPEIAEEHPDESVTLESLAGVRKTLDWLTHPRRFGTPEPYLAVLVADGDRMGAAISHLESAAEHRAFSRQLARFARQARDAVQAHQGVLVYSGGDDVLAFVPVDKCLQCARRLHDEFGERMRQTLSSPGDVQPPTLSVGIGIGHFMEPMEDLLDLGRQAESVAKRGLPGRGQPERDGLAIRVHARGGVPFTVRAPWSDDPDHRLQRWAGLFSDKRLPAKAAYDLRNLSYNYDRWSDGASLAPAIRAEALRVLKRKQSRSGPAELDKVAALLRTISTPGDLRDVARELLAAQLIAVVQDQATGRRGRTGEGAGS